jgi:hypothetical protein
LRCRYQIKVFIFEETFWIERENGKTIFLRLKRPTWVMQQCQVTTRQKTAKCWRDHSMCGEHAAMMHPHLYPKAKGHPTGGRHGLNHQINLLQTITVH